MGAVWATRVMVFCAMTSMNALLAYTAVIQRLAATTPWAVTAVSASMDTLEMVLTARISMNVKKKMEVATPALSVPTLRAGDSASVKWVLQAMASNALILMNALNKAFATGMPPAQTTLDLICVPVMPVIREMGTTCVWI